MVYVALLRGINVGGSNKVAMKDLKEVFENAGMADVTTYINSGNVVFSSTIRSRPKLTETLEKAIAKRFGLNIRILVRDLNNIRVLIKALPKDWKNDDTMKCDVMFLWKEVDRPSIVEELTAKPEIEDVIYVPGAVIWRVDRDAVTRSGMMRMAGTPLYKQMTIRNCNTARKILELMELCR